MDFERNRQRNRLESFVLYEPVAGLESLAGVEWNRNSIRAALFRRGSSTSNVSKGSGENEAFEAIEPIPQVLKCAVFSSVRRFEGRWQSVSHQKKKNKKKGNDDWPYLSSKTGQMQLGQPQLEPFGADLLLQFVGLVEQVGVQAPGRPIKFRSMPARYDSRSAPPFPNETAASTNQSGATASRTLDASRLEDTLKPLASLQFKRSLVPTNQTARIESYSMDAYFCFFLSIVDAIVTIVSRYPQLK